jgi:hypothetical protein
VCRGHPKFILAFLPRLSRRPADIAIAAYVGMSRLHDNRHFVSDVLFGGALGVASGWTVVGRHGRSSYAVMPVPVPGGFMVRLSRNPSPRPAS